MNCKVGWTFEFIESNLPPNWIKKTYHLHRQTVLFERELAQMPATQPLVEREREKRILLNMIEDITSEKIAAGKLRSKGKMNYFVFCEICKQCENSIGDAYLRLRVLDSSPDAETKKYKYVRTCPGNDCKGFLNENWKCGLCDTDVCSKCHVIKTGDAHNCKPEDLETAKLLNKDSKPCPTCAAMIFKIDGCDQMFCTQCHTAFSWKTGVVENKRIHNPHYYEWIRKNNHGIVPRNPGDGCNHEDAQTFRGYGKRVLRIHRLLTHIQHVEMPCTHVNMTDDPFQQLRIQYMLNDITAEDYKRKLVTTESSRRRRHGIWQVLDMFYNTGMDMLRSLHNGTLKSKKELIDQFAELISYVNTNLETIGKQHKCKVPNIDAAAYDMNESLSRSYINRKKAKENKALEDAMAALTV